VSIRDMIDSSVKCSICGKAGYMTCDCWAKCVRCGWAFEAQKECRNRECGGDGVLTVTHGGTPARKRKPARK
jgi:hypothetical protein